MTPTIVGSRAIKYWIPEYKVRDGADLDIIGDDLSNCVTGTLHRVEQIQPVYNDIFLCEQYSTPLPLVRTNIMSLEGLAIMYRSHLWRATPKFHQHMFAYHCHLKEYLNMDLALVRQAMTIEALGVGNPNLNQSNEGFFDDVVDKKYDHDWIHDLAAHYDEPMYMKMKYPDKRHLARCEKKLWDLFTYEEQIKCALEECYVIACERWMIPNNWEFSRLKAVDLAMTKLCTTLTSGWFRDFCIDNYPDLWYNVDLDHIDRIKEKINDAERENRTIFYGL